MGKKIREAEQEWIPRIIVLGDKEIKSNKYNIRVRESDEQVSCSLDELIAEIKTSTKDEPYKPLPLPRKITLRPRFA